MECVLRAAGIASLTWLSLAMAGPACAVSRFADRAPASAGERLAVALEHGSVRIESHDRDEVRVEADVRGLGASGVRFRLERETGGLRLRVDRDAWLRFLSGGPSVRVRIRVPRVFSVDVATAAGHIEVNALRGDVTARSRGGEIRVENVEGRVEAATGDGQIRIAGVTGAVDARTRGGPIALALPKRARANLDARTRSGRIHVEPGVALSGDLGPRYARGAINGGGDPLLLRTAAGHITLRAN